MRIAIFLLFLLTVAPALHAAAEADLLVAYDNTYSDSVGGDDNAEVIAANGVAGSNAINDRSGTGARMRICGYHKTWWQGGRSTLGGYVNWLQNYGDGELDDVTAAADARGADLVAYICPPNAGEGSAAVAQQPGRYAAYGPGNFWSNIVAHESGGHNYGIAHEGGRENPKTIMLHNYCGGGAQGYYSNPNIWLNGVKLQGDGGCLGGPAHGGDVAYTIGAAAQGVADRNARVHVAPNLGSVVRRWRLDQPAGGAPGGTAVTDEVGGTALLTVQGNNAQFTGGGLRIPGGSPASGQAYLQLPSGLTDGHSEVTIEIWARPMSARNWGRLVSLNDGTTGNYLFLSSSAGTDPSLQRFESNNGGAFATLDSNLPTFPGRLHHYTLTFDDFGGGNGRWHWYRDGDLVAWLDVGYDLSSFPDLNTWLGRSVYGGDDLGDCEYAEVRVSNVLMNPDQVRANYLLGPNHDGTSSVTQTAGDAFGTTSFNQAGHWSTPAAPSAGNRYDTHGFDLRTPPNGSSHAFAGDALTVSGGRLIYKGSGTTITINDLTVRGPGELVQAGSGTWTLAGGLSVESEEVIVRAANGPMNLNASLSGNGGLLCVNNTVTLGGSNAAYDGRIQVGDGRFGRLDIDSEARLGANPAGFAADHLTLNRGILYTSANVTIDDPNRGIRIGESAGIFNVAPGTTLAIDVPLSSPASGDTLQTAPLYPNPVSGLFIKDNGGKLRLTHPNNSYIGEMIINGGVLEVTGAGRMNNGDHHMPITNNGTLRIGTSANQILGGVVSGEGAFVKAGTGTTTLLGANPMSGPVTVDGGTLFANADNAATDRNLSQVSGITVHSGATLRSSANSLFGWDGSQVRPITAHAGATLTTDATGDDVNVGTVTLDGGTLAGFASPTWGSWNFKRAGGAKLNVTADSTVSAPNVGLGADNAIDVAAGSTLTFSGAITDLASEGVCALTRSGGAGTLVLSGANTYSGPTALDAGTTLVNGSLGTTPVTVAAAATLGGTGTISGASTINGIHAPGTSAGTQNFGSTLDYGATSRLEWELSSNSTSAGDFDRVVASGAVTVAGGAKVDLILDASGSTVALDDAFWTQPRTWTFLTAPGISGSLELGTVSSDPGGRPVSDYGTLALQQDATSVSLVFTPHTPAEIWRLAHFGSIENIPPGADDEDPDNDRIINLLERALGGDPNSADPGILPRVDDSAPLLSIIYRRSLAATDLTFEVQESTDLALPWSPAAGGQSVLSDDGSIQEIRFTRPAGDDTTLFLRLGVSAP